MTTAAIQTIRDEHGAVAAMLRSLTLLAEQGPGERPQRFFEVVRSMLFYIDEFPERRHHPNESEYVFPILMRGAPQLRGVIERLEAEHESGERRVRELQHLLVAWEVLGDSRRDAFIGGLTEYVRFYLDHMRTEETELLPALERLLSEEERVRLDAIFTLNRDPMVGGTRDPEYEALFDRIVQIAPAPIGLGEA